MSRSEAQNARALVLSLWQLSLEEGYTPRADVMALRVGAHRTTVRRWVREAGLPLRPRGRPLTSN